MKLPLTFRTIALPTLLLTAFLTQCPTLFAQGTAFTYQGLLNSSGAVANGSFDLRFALFDAASSGAQHGGALTNAATAVSNGYFTVTLDFGNQFPGANRWLEIAVRTNGGGVFATLSPRQPLTSTPYAVRAANFSGLVGDNQLSANISRLGTSIDSSEITDGTIVNADINPAAGIADTKLATISTAGKIANSATTADTGNAPNTIVLRDGVGGVTAGSVTASNLFGNGSGLTSLNASQLAIGTVPDAALSNAWKLAGNTGTTPGAQFLGTADNQALELKVNNARVLRLEPNATSPNVLGGYAGNFISNGVAGAVIAGGGRLNNSNRVGGSFSTVGGGYNNLASFGSAVVAGGDNNTVANDRATVSGGYSNRATGLLSTVGGGDINLASGPAATVPGGSLNAATAAYGFAAGRRAKANHQGAFVWADSQNADFPSSASNQFLIRAAGGVGIGVTNPVSALHVNGTVTATQFNGNGAGLTNVIAQGLDPSGVLNLWKLDGNAGTDPATNFLGTTDNRVLELRANGTTALRLSRIDTTGVPNLIGGFGGNTVEAGYQGVVIAGGGGAGVTNRVLNGNATTISGGSGNTVSGEGAVIGGGVWNSASAQYATVGGGYSNRATGLFSTVVGGGTNLASGNYSTAMGAHTTASGHYSTAMGFYAEASGHYSTAMGFGARALHGGSFVWADHLDVYFDTTASNQFLIRASGGVGINTTAPDGVLGVDTGVGKVSIVNDDAVVPGLVMTGGGNPGILRLRNSLEIWPNTAATSAGRLDVRGTNGVATITMDGANGTITCVSLSQTSDRNAKENFQPVNPQAVLQKVVALPLSEWNYRTDAERTRHLGPMAQDFHAAFGLGTDDRRISVVDADGVALAAIQGLNQKLDQKETELTELKQSVHELKELVQAMHHKLSGTAK